MPGAAQREKPEGFYLGKGKDSSPFLWGFDCALGQMGVKGRKSLPESQGRNLDCIMLLLRRLALLIPGVRAGWGMYGESLGTLGWGTVGPGALADLRSPDQAPPPSASGHQD